MPIAFASLLGGTIFVIGTSTNLVVSAVLQKNGMPPIGFTELTPVGVPFTVIGVVVVSLLSRWLLPDRSAEDAADDAGAREYLAEIDLPEGSRYAGAKLDDLTTGLGLRVLAVLRDGGTVEPQPGLVLQAGDALVLEEDRLDLLRVKDLRGLRMKGDAGEDEAGDVILAEAGVPVGSSLVGRSLAEAFFAEHFGLSALAIARRPAIQRLTRAQLVGGLFGTQSIATLPLAVGDILLLRGPRARLRQLADGRTLSLLGNVEYQPVRSRKAAIAVVIFLAVLGVCILRLAPYSVAGLCGLIAMIATRCVDASVAFRVDWRVLLLIGSMMALGTAMETSGTGGYLASLIVPLAHHFGPRAVLVAIMLITVVVSTPMSNQAAALVLLPVAFGVAKALQLNPRTFAMGVCLAASCSFLFPMEPACVLVYGPGRYKFFDYTRLGAPLTAILIGLLTFIIPWRWPF
jgi:di/tricarboxylate transporter